MQRGLIVGKFYPPHRGHKYFIDTAQKQVDHLAVVVCMRSDQTIPAHVRSEWMKRIHPDADVHIAEDIKKDDDPHAWAKYLKKLLAFTPDVLFTSEDYGEQYARILGSKHVLVDKERTIVPISGTKIRGNPLQYLEYLEPCVRDYFIKTYARR